MRCISRHHDVVRSSKQSLRHRKRLEKLLLIRYSRLSALTDCRREARTVNCRIAMQIDRQLAKLSPAPLLGLAPGMNFESAQSANCGCSRPRPKKTAERKKTPDENPPHENLRRKSPAEKKERNEFHSSTSFEFRTCHVWRAKGRHVGPLRRPRG